LLFNIVQIAKRHDNGPIFTIGHLMLVGCGQNRMSDSQWNSLKEKKKDIVISN